MRRRDGDAAVDRRRAEWDFQRRVREGTAETSETSRRRDGGLNWGKKNREIESERIEMMLSADRVSVWYSDLNSESDEESWLMDWAMWPVARAWMYDKKKFCKGKKKTCWLMTVHSKLISPFKTNLNRSIQNYFIYGRSWTDHRLQFFWNSTHFLRGVFPIPIVWALILFFWIRLVELGGLFGLVKFTWINIIRGWRRLNVSEGVDYF